MLSFLPELTRSARAVLAVTSACLSFQIQAQVNVEAHAGVDINVYDPYFVSYNSSSSGYGRSIDVGSQSDIYYQADSAPKYPIDASYGSPGGPALINFGDGGGDFRIAYYESTDALGASAKAGFLPQPYIEVSADHGKSSFVPYEFDQGYSINDFEMGVRTATAQFLVSRTPKASASLDYNFSLKSAPNTLVPVNFSGAIKFSDAHPGLVYDPLSGVSAYIQSSNEATINIGYGGSAGWSEVGAKVLLENTISPSWGKAISPWEPGRYIGPVESHTFQVETFQSLSGTLHFKGDAMPAVSGRWLSSFETTLYGSFFAKTDQYGFAGGVVKIAGAALGGVTFVDPILTVDQSFLALNPETTISLPSGIGNAPMNSVPEPSSYVLLFAGLAVVWVVRRRLRA